MYNLACPHPNLFGDNECLATVIEVAEIGISGTRSQNRTSGIPVMKENMDLSPASRRVQDAAEVVQVTKLLELYNFNIYLVIRVVKCSVQLAQKGQWQLQGMKELSHSIWVI